MGLYYQPPPVHLGAAQPYSPKELTPDSGPTPQNPVFAVAAAVTLLSTVIGAWSADAAPYQPRRNFIPPAVSGPPARAQTTPAAVLRWWVPADPQPQVAINLDPPISGPAPQNPPFMGGARVSTAVLIGWLPPPPRPPQAVNLDPPISGPTPQNPPFAGGAHLPGAVAVWWLPPPPQAPVAVNLDPPRSGPLPQNPPFMGGAKVPSAVLAGWLPPPPQPPRAVSLNPLGTAPIITGSANWIVRITGQSWLGESDDLDTRSH